MTKFTAKDLLAAAERNAFGSNDEAYLERSRIVRETEKALRIEAGTIDGGAVEFWVPKSATRTVNGKLVVKGWALAGKTTKQLEAFNVNVLAA